MTAEPRRYRKILWLLAAVYAGILLSLLLCREPVPRPGNLPQRFFAACNFYPLRTVRLYARLLRHPAQALRRLAAVNLAGNILLFLPLGFFPPALSPGFRRFWKTLLLAAGLVAAVEILQALTGVGRCDVDDLLLNVLGAGLGYGIFRLAEDRKSSL